MNTITLDAKGWTTEEDFYAALLPRLGAPEWHGHNLDALQESIRFGNINAVNVPYRIVIGSTSLASPKVQRILVRFREMVDHLRTDERVLIELEISIGKL